ncbi:MAG: MerR family transcriptional regulator [Bacteroidia bacterium]|nr:MerR family transcriptional regulator [Bacteroidia bacterium]
MNSYQIADLERLTGIKAHTIRIWEKRYNLIEPHRTSTNIRYYDDDQARKLLKVSTLLAQGIKISKISELSDKEINSRIQELQHVVSEDAICTGFINELTAAMLAFDETAFEKTFSSAVIRFGMYQAMLKVFYPFLHKTGLMWSMEEAMPVQEHFASAIIRRKLITATDGLPAPSKRSKSFVLFLPNEEWHETGLLFSDYIIRTHGYKTVYLGQNVPANNLLDVIKNVKPTHLLTLYIARHKPEQIVSDLLFISKKHPGLKLMVAGSYPLDQLVKKIKNITLLSSPSELVKNL